MHQQHRDWSRGKKRNAEARSSTACMSCLSHVQAHHLQKPNGSFTVWISPASVELMFLCRPRAQTAATGAPAQQQKRTMFGRKKVTTPHSGAAGYPASDQPTYANQPQGALGTQGQGAAPMGAQAGPAGNGYPRQGERAILSLTAAKTPFLG